MTHDTTLTEIFNLRSAKTAPEEEPGDLRPETYQAFRTDPQVRPSHAMLDLWYRNGDQEAVEYNHFYKVHYKRSLGIIITLSEDVVTIEGHGLDRLHSDLKRHRVIFIWEASEQDAALAGDHQPVITKIEIKPRQPSVQEI